MKKPANINWEATIMQLEELISMLPDWVRPQITDVERYVVKQVRGRAYMRGGKAVLFTIPDWVFKKPLDYQLWYVAHEIAHIMNYKTLGVNGGGHGVEFHEWLKKICPKASQHHEWAYMKRSEARGVGAKDDDEWAKDIL